MIQKRNNDHLKKAGPWIENATSASPSDTRYCMAIIQNRLVRVISTNGLHSGLMTHGRYSQLVYSAISVLEMPNRLYMTTDMVMTITYGMPSEK